MTKFWTKLIFFISCLLLWPSGVSANAPHSHHMRTPIDWHRSSETVAYPNLKHAKDLWVEVDLKSNRTYLFSGHHLLYTMYSSAGEYRKNPQTNKRQSFTPTGTFYVSNIRKDHIFNPHLGLGANYCVSWNGDYMFHSVVTDEHSHHYLKGLANKLGKAPSSPGCVCLSIPDAQWIEHHLPTGTKVEVVDR